MNHPELLHTSGQQNPSLNTAGKEIVYSVNLFYTFIKLSTQCGDILIELNIEKAPISANNFLAYVQGGHFDKFSFYRTVTHANDNHELKIAGLQGGIDVDFDGVFEPEFLPIAHESTADTDLLHTRSAVSFARGDLRSAQSEFFISTDNNPALNAGGLRHPDKQGFAVFGQVLEEMDVGDKIAALPSDKVHPDSYVRGQVLNKPVGINASVIN